jgi:ssDNA-binding Zn-finger/Zn-ribbon topoisomerase 1
MVDIRCPKCGRETTIRTSKKDGSQYFICLKYPKCKGRVPVEEDWSEGWGQESAAPEAARDILRLKREPSPSESAGGTAVRKSGKAKRRAYGIIKRPRRKGRVSIDKSKGDDREKPAPEPANDRLRRRRVAPVEEIPSEGKEPPESKGQRKAKPASYRPLYKRGPGPAPVLPREPERLKPAPYRPLYQKPPRWETVPESDESPEPKGQRWSKLASYRPLYRRGPTPAPVAPQEPGGPPPPYKPLFPRAEKRRLFSKEQEPAKPRRRKAPKAAHEEPRPKKAPKAE